MRAWPPATRHLIHRGIAAGAVLTCGLLGLPAAAAAPAAAPGSTTATTVPAPGAGARASVTVSDTHGLVNQSVTVSWKGFTPSSASVLSNGDGSYDQNTRNPVRVYECRGAKPASSSDCYGSPGFAGVPEVNTGTTDYPAVAPVPGYTYPGQTTPSEVNPNGPANFEDTVSDANGAGSVTLQIFTDLEAPTLGCDPSHECSIVVVPNYGRSAGPGAATEANLDAPWAWADRTVVPLTFAPLGATCTLSKSPLTVEGSPIDARLMASWQVGACHAKTGAVDANYTSIGEPQSRGDFSTGVSDVGLTIRSLPSTPAHAPVYAPFALSSLVVAFQVDDANGRPVTSMRLNARLVAKIVTASYRVADDSNVSPNAPFNLFHDPEFLKLNPGVKWPDGTPGNHPILLSDASDLTWELTRWLNSDPTARAFLNGAPDPWGMTVNAAYKGIKLPVQNFPSLDEHQANAFIPIQGLDQVARQLSIAQFPGGTTEIDNGVTNVSKYPRQNPGSHEILGIVDAADAADFLLPTAALQNAAGRFVTPTDASVLAAEAHMTVGADGVTREPGVTSKVAAAYPLPILTTALLPTGKPAAKTALVGRLIHYTSTAGQRPGNALGELPAGYVPLPRNLRAQDRAAIKALTAPPRANGGHHRGGSGHHRNSAHNGGTTNPPGSGSTGSTAVPAVKLPPPAAPQVSSGGPTTGGGAPVVAQTLAAVKDVVSAHAMLLWLLLAGGAAFLAGPVVIWGRREWLAAPHLALARLQLPNWHWRSSLWRRR